jgi:hypothetical protein
MTRATIRHGAGIAAAVLLVSATIASAAADCGALPTSALRTRPCNPQAECLAAIAKDAKPGEAEARRKQCSRLPTTGVCHGPETYNPQDECRQQQRKR